MSKMNRNAHYMIFPGMIFGCLALSTACQGEPPHAETDNAEPESAPVVQRFSCAGAGCPPPEELQRQLGGCAPLVRLENSRIDIEVTVKSGIRRDGRDAHCDPHGMIGGISSGR